MICVVCQRDTCNVERGLVGEPCRRPLPALLDDIAHLSVQVDVTPAQGGGGGRPSGKPGSRPPIDIDAADLTAPARGLNLAFVDSEQYPRHQQIADQIGPISVASRLDGWVQDWREVRGRGEGNPLPTVPVLANWLAVRLDWACDEHMAVDQFVDEMRELRAELRATTGQNDPRPERLWTPCRGCDWRALTRNSSDDYPITCANCGLLYTLDEYNRLTGLHAAAAKEMAA